VKCQGIRKGASRIKGKPVSSLAKTRRRTPGRTRINGARKPKAAENDGCKTSPLQSRQVAGRHDGEVRRAFQPRSLADHLGLLGSPTATPTLEKQSRVRNTPAGHPPRTHASDESAKVPGTGGKGASQPGEPGTPRQLKTLNYRAGGNCYGSDSRPNKGTTQQGHTRTSAQPVDGPVVGSRVSRPPLQSRIPSIPVSPAIRG
jgi:hypothetical protein